MSVFRELGIKASDVVAGDYIAVLPPSAGRKEFVQVERVMQPYKPIGAFGVGPGYRALLFHTVFGDYIYSGSETIRARITQAGGE